MLRLRSVLRNPFSFLFAGSSKEERLAAYLIREHERGRPLHEIVEDPYVRNRASQSELPRILERPEVVEALGRAAVREEEQRLS